MGFVIYFLYSDSSDKKHVRKILKGEEYASEAGNIIPDSVSSSILQSLIDLKLTFQKVPSTQQKQSEIHFSHAQLTIYPGQIAMRIPYDSNLLRDKYWSQIKGVIEAILEHGLIGWNPQTGDFIRDSSEIKNEFSKNSSMVSKVIGERPFLSKKGLSISLVLLIISLLSLLIFNISF
ncbi:MAG: hypothetical protein MRZ79_23665 [Bacteroidia bacterium]|nr:hypothetical protein [Bacteroidia bacterium]